MATTKQPSNKRTTPRGKREISLATQKVAKQIKKEQALFEEWRRKIKKSKTVKKDYDGDTYTYTFDTLIVSFDLYNTSSWLVVTDRKTNQEYQMRCVGLPARGLPKEVIKARQEAYNKLRYCAIEQEMLVAPDNNPDGHPRKVVVGDEVDKIYKRLHEAIKRSKAFEKFGGRTRKLVVKLDNWTIWFDDDEMQAIDKETAVWYRVDYTDEALAKKFADLRSLAEKRKENMNDRFTVAGNRLSAMLTRHKQISSQPANRVKTM